MDRNIAEQVTLLMQGTAYGDPGLAGGDGSRDRRAPRGRGE
jgi:hypothetical protein